MTEGFLDLRKFYFRDRTVLQISCSISKKVDKQLVESFTGYDSIVRQLFSI